KAAAEFIKEQLNSRSFDDISDKMLLGVFYGYAVAECLWAYDGSRIVLDAIQSDSGVVIPDNVIIELI
ncbi:DUF935 domain-containing protein, partial [Endozoicomonas sp. ONNA2]|uniref:DUF935 domain-containing protein n=1 Tax=Endozoicomonas sp. ONNA2 TaxID=2828741 RepID=UPI002148F68E